MVVGDRDIVWWVALWYDIIKDWKTSTSLDYTQLHRSEVEQMKKELERVLKDLQRSVPFYSTRYRVIACVKDLFCT